jgi:hypothetical protein
MNHCSSVCRPDDPLRQVWSNGSLQWEKSRPLDKYWTSSSIAKNRQGCTRRNEHDLYSVMSARLSHNSVGYLPFLTADAGLNPSVVCMGFLVNKMELAQVPFLVLRLLLCQLSFYRWCILICNRDWYNRAIWGRCTKGLSLTPSG